MADYTLIQSGDADAAENVGALAGDIDRTGIVSGLALSNYDAATPSVDVASGKTVHVLDSALAEWTLDDGTQQSEQRDQVQLVCHLDAQTTTLTDSDVNHLFVEPNWDTDDSPEIVTNTTGSAPSTDALKIGEVDTANDTVSGQWHLINPDGTLTFPDGNAASAALSSLPDGTPVYDRTNDVRIVDGAFSATTLEAGGFNFIGEFQTLSDFDNAAESGDRGYITDAQQFARQP